MGGRGNHAQGGVNPLSPGEMNGSGGSGRAQRMLLARSRPNERYTAMRVFSGSAGSMALKQFCAKWLQLYSRTSQNLPSRNLNTKRSEERLVGKECVSTCRYRC